MNPQGNDYFGAEAVASFNGFPVLRNVIQKYDAKDAKHTLTAAFLGYRAKEDITALPPNFLVQPSQNVLHLASGLIYSRPGYTLDGQAATTTNIIDGIQSSYDWISYVGAEKHLRGHQNSLEYRYVSPTGQVSWLPLMNQNTMSKWDGNGFFRYAEYWNTTESLQELLFVNGDGNIYNWNGAQAAFANATSAALSMNPFLAETPPGEIICITGPAGSTITGTSSNAANYVLTGTLTTPSGLVNVPVALIIITTQPTAGDTLTLTTGNGMVTMTFVSCPYEPPWKFGYGSGSISIGYNYTEIGGPAIYFDVPNLSSPSITQTRNNLLQFLINPGLQQAAFYVGNSTYANVLAPLTINANPVITGSTTTAGNVISFPPDGGTLTFAMVNNPANGDTAIFTIQGQPVQFQFVSVIGTTPGNVLIAGTPALTLANLEALITTPGTTTANGVALSTENQYIISLFQGVISTGITIQGQQSWLDLGFYSLTGGRSVVINGATFTYTGGESGLTITGVTPDPTTTITINYGDPIVQAPMYVPWTSVTDYAAGFLPDLIAVTGNQVFYGDSTRRDFYISVTNDRNNLTVNSPRLPGDGGQLIADSPVTAFIVQETVMYVGCSPDWWYTVVFGPQENQSVTVSGTTVVTTYEPLVLQTLKTSPGQGPQSQEGVFKVKNSAFVITNEPAIDDFTRIQNDLEMPEAQTLTDSIKNDFLQYNLTGAYGLYIKYFLYVVLPVENKMLVYNFFQAWWEPPQVFPFSRLSIIDGKLYAHSAYVAETYRVFIDNPLDPETVYDDNGQPINCIAAFSYNNFGTRDIKKQFTEFFVEGYISSNTTLTCASKFDFGGYSGTQTFSLSGALASNLVYTYADNSIGKVPLGKNPIGSITDSLSNLPKFRHIFTGINIDFFEYQPYFQTNDVDQQWQLLAIAVDQKPSDSSNIEIKT